MAMPSHHSSTFVFTRNFDDEVASEAALRAREGPQSYNEADLARAVAEAEERGRAEGLAEGHAAGLKDAAQEISATTSASLEALIPLMTGFSHAVDQLQSSMEGQMLSYADALCQALFPQLIQHFGADHVERQIAFLLGKLQGRAALTIHVSPGVSHDITERLPMLAASSLPHCEMRVVADPALGDAEARITWSDGFARIDYGALTRSILRDLHVATRETSPNMQHSHQE